jgi:hypothetical protein
MLSPKAFEQAYKNDESIRATAEEIFREWSGNVERAEAAWELDRMIESERDPDRALALMLGVMAIDDNEKEFGMLGAGPLEDFLNRSGTEYIDVIEALAAKNPSFKRVLSGVWQTTTVDLRVWKRVERICGDVGSSNRE